MEYTKIIGIILIILSVVFAFTTFSLTLEIKKLGNEIHKQQLCSLPLDICPMFKTPTAAIISYIFSGLLFLSGLYLVIAKKTTTIKKPGEIKKIVSGLENDEKRIYQLILEAQGTIFQSELVEKSGFSKVKVTRILDKLEGKQLIDRKRRGMTNVVILRQK